jgi:hypothetical protein
MAKFTLLAADVGDRELRLYHTSNLFLIGTNAFIGFLLGLADGILVSSAKGFPLGLADCCLILDSDEVFSLGLVDGFSDVRLKVSCLPKQLAMLLVG